MARTKSLPLVEQSALMPSPVLVTGETNLNAAVSSKTNNISKSSFNRSKSCNNAVNDVVNPLDSRASIPVETSQPRDASEFSLQSSRFPGLISKDIQPHGNSFAGPASVHGGRDIGSLASPSSRDLYSAHASENEMDLPLAYIQDAFKLYPARKDDVTGDEATEPDDFHARVKLPKITDADEIIETLEDLEKFSFEELYWRVVNAQSSLVAWQNEWLKYERWIKTTDYQSLVQTAKDKTKDNNFGIRNPRIVKFPQTGQADQDIIEAFAYGYEHNPHSHKVGFQDPIAQRYYDDHSGTGRHLRQRVPTKKAVEGDVSESPDPEVASMSRRSRRQTVPFEIAGASSSRLSSETIEPPPKSTFASGKRRGRPPTKKPGAQRIVELQREHGPNTTPSGPIPSMSEVRAGPSSTSAAEPGRLAMARSTEWDDASDSRPGTSASATTGTSTETDVDQTDDENDSGLRRRRRQQTSDFEGSGPSKLPQRKVGIFSAPSIFSIVGLEHLTPDELAAKKKKFDDKQRAWETRRKNQAKREALQRGEPNIDDSHGEDAERDSSERLKAPASLHPGQEKRKIILAKKQSAVNGDITDEISHDEGYHPRTPANGGKVKVSANSAKIGKLSKKLSTKKSEPSLSAAPKEKKEKGQTAASRNMMERWRKKKEAEALGLPVPAIGRYPKGLNTPKSGEDDVKPEIDQSNMPAAPEMPRSAKAGEKRKRIEEMPNGITKIGTPDENELFPPKKRGGARIKGSGVSKPNDLSNDGSAYATGPGPIQNQQPPKQSPTGLQTGEDDVVELAVPKKRGSFRGRKVAVKSEIANNGGPNGADNDVSEHDTIAKAPQAKHRGGRQRQMVPANSVEEDTSEPRPMVKGRRGSRRTAIVAASPAPRQEDGDDQEENFGPTNPRRTGRVRKPTPAVIESRPGSSGGPADELTRPLAKGSEKKKVERKRPNLDAEPQDVSQETSSIADSKPKRKRKRPAHFYDGAADDDDDSSPAPKRRHARHSLQAPLAHKMSEYEEYQALSSPAPSDLDKKRGRRSAALKARQSFGAMDGAMDDADDEDVQSQVEQQFASEYDHYQALASPKSPVLLGKRKRKPVVDMEEVIRMEANDEDDFDGLD
ncbi:MAG: hypothetical protein M1818_006769 [Claussenomyces sp. TS43310]|nr:MAG: hypothetical protein M1818_006769 [Claussenomyces sp. TS43310]